MNYKYLNTGMQVIIEEETENSFFVRPVLTAETEDYEGRYEEIEVYGDMIKVAKNQLFDKAPTEKHDSEIEAKNQKLEELKKEILVKSEELSKIKQEIYRDNLTKVNEERFIINRSEIMKAESIAFFPESRINPIIRKSQDKNFRGLKLSTVIEISSGEERNWGYSLYFDYESSSDYLDKEFGLVINPTEEKLIEISLQRQEKKKFEDWHIMRADDKYLSEENKQKKNELWKLEKANEIEKTKKQIEEAKLHLQNLETKLHLEQ